MSDTYSTCSWLTCSMDSFAARLYIVGLMMNILKKDQNEICYLFHTLHSLPLSKFEGLHCPECNSTTDSSSEIPLWSCYWLIYQKAPLEPQRGFLQFLHTCSGNPVTCKRMCNTVVRGWDLWALYSPDSFSTSSLWSFWLCIADSTNDHFNVAA